MLFLQIVLFWLLAGVTWSGFFTGTYVIKAVRWHHNKDVPFDLLSVIGLVLSFVFSAITWPISIWKNWNRFWNYKEA